MPPKLRSKTIYESQYSVSDVVEAAHEGFILAMVEQFEKNTTNILQEEFASNNPFKQKASIGTINDDDTHIPNVVEFQVIIENLHRLNTLVRQRFVERMVAQVEADFKQLKVMSTKTKAMLEFTQALIDKADEHTRKAFERIRANVVE